MWIPGAYSDLDAQLVAELVVQDRQAVAHPGGGPHRAERVVLVEARDAEHGHDRVADELLHGAAVMFEHLAHRVEVAAHQPAERLGIETLAERGGPSDIGEQDGDGLANLGSDDADASGVPHAWQKRARSEFSSPHWGHARTP